MLGMRPQREMQFRTKESFEKYDIHGGLEEAIYELKEVVDSLDGLADDLDYIDIGNPNSSMYQYVYRVLALASKVEDCQETIHMALASMNYREREQRIGGAK